MNAAGHFSEPLAEQWDGATWSVAPTTMTDNGTLANVTCLSASACWAVGAFSVPTGTGPAERFGPAESHRTVGRQRVVGGRRAPTSTTVSVLYGVACSRGAQCFATGSPPPIPTTSPPRRSPRRPDSPPPARRGSRRLPLTAECSTSVTAGFYGSMGGHHLVAPTVGTAVTPDGRGYWLVAADGGVFSFGDAGFFGSMGGARLDAPIVGMAATPDGRWLLAGGGRRWGLLLRRCPVLRVDGWSRPNAPVVGMAATPDGGGYWLVAADGGVFSFGDARFFGSMAGSLDGNRATALAATPDGGGYWLVGRDGGVFAFGDAGFFGSVPGQGLVADAPVTGISVSPDGRGYWLVATNGSCGQLR